MKPLTNYLSESTGQRMSLRKGNRPYSPDADPLVAKKNEREEKATLLKAKRIIKDIIDAAAEIQVFGSQVVKSHDNWLNDDVVYSSLLFDIRIVCGGAAICSVLEDVVNYNYLEPGSVTSDWDTADVDDFIRDLSVSPEGYLTVGEDEIEFDGERFPVRDINTNTCYLSVTLGTDDDELFKMFDKYIRGKGFRTDTFDGVVLQLKDTGKFIKAAKTFFDKY